MPTSVQDRSPRWYTIPVRIVLLTFVGTLICFAVSLLAGIIGVVIVAIARGTQPDMTVAYRHIALPVAAVVGWVILLVSSFTEIRHYRQSKALAAIERVS